MCECEKQPTNRKKLSADRWIAFSAFIVALAALILSIYNSWLSRDYLRKSTKPEMLASYFYNENGSGFMFGNVGLGPAYLEWFQILVDDTPQSNWLSMGAALGLSAPPDFEFVRPGRIYQIDSYNKTFWVPSGPIDDELRANKSRIEIRACYCSIFNECWIETNKNDPVSVDSCKPYPDIRYGGAKH